MQSKEEQNRRPTNRVKKAVYGKLGLLSSEQVLDTELVEQIAVTETLRRHRIPHYSLQEENYQGGREFALLSPIRTILGLFSSRLAMIFDARSSPRRTKT